MGRTRDRLHVLHVIDGLGLGGAERVLVDLVNRTIADGHEASVCVTRNVLVRAGELDPRAALLVLDRQRRVSPSAMLRLVRWARVRHVDLIHAHMRSTAAHMLLLRGLRILHVPIVFHDHYGGIEIDRSIPAWFRIGHHFADHYVGVSPALCEWARGAGMAPQRCTFIGNTVDLGKFTSSRSRAARGAFAAAPGDVVGALIATLRPDKGIEVLLDAMSRLRPQAGLRVVVVGADGDPEYARACRQRSVELGVTDSVTFLGARDDVPALLAAADFGVLSSHTESGPLVLLEYAASGLPLVSTRVGDIGHSLADLGVPGFVAAGDASALARELDALLALPPEERVARGELGRRLVTERWNLTTKMPSWYKVYRDVLAAA